MTINRDGREMEIQCEDCSSSTLSYDKDDFQTMVTLAKIDGWEIRPDRNAEGGYSHYCRDCRGSNRLQRARDLLG